MTARQRFVAAAVIATALAFGARRGEAHKPITSPYTFNEHVFPILEARCLQCHAPGGAAPMALTTHAETVPWGESIRMELIAGHMPPWPVLTSPARFRNAGALSGRELNILLTWASGGTPVGDANRTPAYTSPSGWPLGDPDLALQMASPFTLGADQQEAVAEFGIATGTTETRWLRAIDLRPGTPAIVRSATVSIGNQLLALWLPGERPVPLDGGHGWRLPAGAELRLRVRYRKTWEYGQKEMTDRTTVGLYFTGGPSRDVQSLALTPGTSTVAADSRALAVHADPALGDVELRAVAVRPDRSREELITLRPRPEWARRYWFAEPIALPRGTRIELTAKPVSAVLPPGATVAPSASKAAPRLFLDVLR